MEIKHAFEYLVNNYGYNIAQENINKDYNYYELNLLF